MTIEDDDFQLQQTYYWCGPAAVRDALSVRHVLISQQQLANELGTTVNGTASIANVINVLSAHLGAGTYEPVYLPGPAVTTAQITKFRQDLQSAVSAGWALVANVVGTAQGVDGRTHSYLGGHYVAVTGIDGDRAWVSDVATGEYWMSIDILVDWIVNRAYARATATTPTPSPSSKGVTGMHFVRTKLGGISLCDGVTREGKPMLWPIPDEARWRALGAGVLPMVQLDGEVDWTVYAIGVTAAAPGASLPSNDTLTSLVKAAVKAALMEGVK